MRNKKKCRSHQERSIHMFPVSLEYPLHSGNNNNNNSLAGDGIVLCILGLARIEVCPTLHQEEGVVRTLLVQLSKAAFALWELVLHLPTRDPC